MAMLLAPPVNRNAHREALQAVRATGVPFLVGGAYALEHYMDHVRSTKDLDVHVHQQDCDALLSALERFGFRVERTFPHWLAKAFWRSEFIDIIFNSGNGLCPVDDEWFTRAEPGVALGLPVAVCPVEELIWSKAFVQERERYDGADVAHLLRARARSLDWPRLLQRFGPHWRVLLGHLVLFGFVYPGEGDALPPWVLPELLDRLRVDAERSPHTRVCQGTLLSREQYLVDVTDWGYRDARRWPSGPLSPEAVQAWTEAARADGDDRRERSASGGSRRRAASLRILSRGQRQRVRNPGPPRRRWEGPRGAPGAPRL